MKLSKESVTLFLFFAVVIFVVFPKKLAVKYYLFIFSSIHGYIELKHDVFDDY